MRKITTLMIFLLGPLATSLSAQSTLFYFEAQATGAYSTSAREFQFFSLMPDDSMQKPGVGFDFVRRFSAKNRDIGTLAVQGRLAYDEQGEQKIEPQLYNAFFRYKAGFADIWAGHSRPALGISATLDNHALLLPSPPMLGFGFDRDWGLGLQRDFSWGDAAASLTTGSGMSLDLNGNFLAAARISKGVPSRDNYSVGFSLAHGSFPEAMHHKSGEAKNLPWTSAGVDLTHFWKNVENRAELLLGRRAGDGMSLFFWRSGLNLLEENRLKVEAQPAIWITGGKSQYSLATGLSYVINSDLTARAMVLRDYGRGDTRFLFQLYYYKLL